MEELHSQVDPIPWSYLFLHIVRLTLQLLDHPVEFSNLTLVVLQVITELAPAAVEFLQLLHRKGMMSMHPNPPSQAPHLHRKLEISEAAPGSVFPGHHPDMASARIR